MLPLTMVSPYMRSKQFVAQEWDEKLRSIVATVEGGWRGILYANYAIANPTEAWQFFTINFDHRYLDSGASLSWYMAFVASLE